jgi:hypothetical protein
MRELFTAKAAADSHNSGVYNEITARRQQKEWEEICDGIETAVFRNTDTFRIRCICDDNIDILNSLGYVVDYYDSIDMYVISWWEDD